jgi:integrase
VIRPRRDGWQVIVYTGIDPLTGRQRQISRQVKGSRKQAERVETRLKAEVLAGRHRGTAAKTPRRDGRRLLEWRQQNGKPIGPRTIQGYRALAEARTKPGLGKLRLPQVDPPALSSSIQSLGPITAHQPPKATPTTSIVTPTATQRRRWAAVGP